MPPATDIVEAIVRFEAKFYAQLRLIGSSRASYKTFIFILLMRYRVIVDPKLASTSISFASIIVLSKNESDRRFL